MTRTIRHRPAQPDRVGGPDADERWAAKSCAQLTFAWDWDNTITLPSGYQRPERTRERTERLKWAAQQCQTCPALALCKQLPTRGITGVMAGKLLRPKGKAA